MKPVYFLLAALLTGASHAAHAQTATKDAVKARLTTNVCDCLTKKSAIKKPDNLSKKQVEQVFIECFAVVATKDMAAIKQAYGPNAFSSQLTQRQIGQEVGAQLVQECPASMPYFVAVANGDEATPTSKAVTTGQTTGRLGGLSGPGVTLLEVQASKTEKVYFAWLRHFDQADELLRKLPELQGQQARISWQEVEVLQPDTKEYQKVREITGIELL